MIYQKWFHWRLFPLIDGVYEPITTNFPAQRVCAIAAFIAAIKIFDGGRLKGDMPFGGRFFPEKVAAKV